VPEIGFGRFVGSSKIRNTINLDLILNNSLKKICYKYIDFSNSPVRIVMRSPWLLVIWSCQALYLMYHYSLYTNSKRTVKQSEKRIDILSLGLTRLRIVLVYFAGCFWIPILLLLYLIVGVILLPFIIFYFICVCLCYPLGCCRDNDSNTPLYR